MQTNFTVVMAKRRTLKERKPRSPSKSAPVEMHGFPKRLKECIEEQNTTATAVAELAEVSTPVVTKAQKAEQWERIGAGNVIRIARALGVRPAWLLFGDGPKSVHDVPVVAPPSMSAEEIGDIIAARILSKTAGSQVVQDKPSGADDK